MCYILAYTRIWAHHLDNINCLSYHCSTPSSQGCKDIPSQQPILNYACVHVCVVLCVLYYLCVLCCVCVYVCVRVYVCVWVYVCCVCEWMCVWVWVCVHVQSTLQCIFFILRLCVQLFGRRATLAYCEHL